MTCRTIRLLVTLALALLVTPLLADAQQPTKVFRTGRLAAGSPPEGPPFGHRTAEAFRQGLRELGYVEGQNLVIEWRFGEGRLERLPELAANWSICRSTSSWCLEENRSSVPPSTRPRPSPLSLRDRATRWVGGSSPAWPILVATSQVSTLFRPSCTANGWNSSKSWCPPSLASRSSRTGSVAKTDWSARRG